MTVKSTFQDRLFCFRKYFCRKLLYNVSILNGKHWATLAMINFTKELPQNTTVVHQNIRSSIQKFQWQCHLEAVFDIRIWGMCETTSGANCQQLTAIRDASYICDAVFPQLQPLLKVNLDLCARRTIFSCFHLLLEKVYFIIYLPASESSETDRESTQLAVCDQLKIKRTKLGTGCSVLTLSEWVNCHFKIWTQRVTFMVRDASYI